MSREQFVNEYTGETWTAAEYHRAVRQVENEIFRLDRAIDELKSSLKSAREDREKAVAALRALARDSRYQTGRPRVVKLKDKAAVQTSARKET